MQRLFRYGLVASLALSACSKTVTEAGLQANVHIEPGLNPTCVVLELRDTSGALLGSAQAPFKASQADYDFGIAQKSLPDNVVLKGRAMGGNSACAAPLSAISDSADSAATFVQNQKPLPLITLEVPCAGAHELCADGLDNTCDGFADCGDPQCGGASCGNGMACLGGTCSCPSGKKVCNGLCVDNAACCVDSDCTGATGQTCQAGTCACPLGQKSCNGACISSASCCGSADCDAGQTCQGGACGCPTGQKGCSGACIAQGSCCTSADCTGVTGQTCQGGTCGCPAGMPGICNGACSASAGCCSSNDCGDGGTCATGTCACSGAFQLCNGVCIPQSQCCTAADCPATGELCAGGNCACPMSQRLCGNACIPASTCCTASDCNATLGGAFCDAGTCQCPGGENLCPSLSMCLPATACCTSADCASPPVCKAAGMCLFTSCAYPNAPDSTQCDAGWECRTGSCQPDFRYPPANFNPAGVTVIAPQATFDCGVTTYNSSTNLWTNWCRNVADEPVPVMVGQDAGPAVLLPVYGFVVQNTGDGGATLIVTGSNPVIFAVYGSASVGGHLIADADHQVAGPGGSSAACGASNGTDGVMAGTGDGAGAGAGAGFGTPGADGGYGDNANASHGMGGVLGAAGGNVQLVPLRGGCRGGKGGDNAGAGGAAGAGGGAIQISASGVLDIAGVISASGGGGRAGGQRAGGGGAGSGGALLLQGQVVNIQPSARISCNGGAGGEGGPDNNPPGDQDGQNGNGANPTVAAAGGSMSSHGGNGGNGAFVTTAATAGQLVNGSAAAGGGGGAGLGRIRIDAASSCIFSGIPIISPAAQGGTGTGCPP